jgi:hypothetical protein
VSKCGLICTILQHNIGRDHQGWFDLSPLGVWGLEDNKSSCRYSRKDVLKSVLSINPPFQIHLQERFGMMLKSQYHLSCKALPMNDSSDNGPQFGWSFSIWQAFFLEIRASLWSLKQFHGVDLHLINVLFSFFQAIARAQRDPHQH